MSPFLYPIPPIAAGLVVGGVVIASGGSILQSSMAGITTGVTGLATSAWVTQTKVNHQKSAQQEQILERLEALEAENQNQLLTFRCELESLQNSRGQLQQDIAKLHQYLAPQNPDPQNLDPLKQPIQPIDNSHELTPKLNEISIAVEELKTDIQRLSHAITFDIDAADPQSGRVIQLEEGSLVVEQALLENPLKEGQDPGEENSQKGETLNKDPQPIVDFLENRNIKVKVIPPEDPALHVVNPLASFLGANYDGLAELLAKIKRNMQQGTTFSFSLKQYSQKDMSDVCNFCTRLHKIAFLEEYRYFKSPQYLLKAKTTTLPAAQNFFSGQWLECFVVLTVQKCIRNLTREWQREINFSYLLNPQIVLPNGDDFELDLIFQVNDFFFWIEAKSGEYQQHISKYSKMSKILNLDFKHSIMVLPDISENQCDALTALFSMTVCPLSRLETVLVEIIRADRS